MMRTWQNVTCTKKKKGGKTRVRGWRPEQAEYHFQINDGGNTPGKRQRTRPAGERRLTNLTHQTQTVCVRTGLCPSPNPRVFTDWSSRGILRDVPRKPCLKHHLPCASDASLNTSSVDWEIMQSDSIVETVDSLITKGTQTSARVEFRETSG